MIKTKFYDNFFKFLVLLFWPIMWFNPHLLPNYFFASLLFIIYFTLSIIYLISFLYFKVRYKNVENIVMAYRFSTLLSFIFTLLSFLLFPKSLTLLFIKMIFLAIYLYYSCIKVFRHKIDEGVVGILSVLLIFVLTY